MTTITESSFPAGLEKGSLAAAAALAVLAAGAFQSACLAKSVGEALNDLSGVQDTDPQGFTLMLVSIGLIGACAITLIVITIVYSLKQNKKKSDSGGA